MCGTLKPRQFGSAKYAPRLLAVVEQRAQPQGPQQVGAALFDPAAEQLLDFAQVAMHRVAVTPSYRARVGDPLSVFEEHLERLQQSLRARAQCFHRTKLTLDKRGGTLRITPDERDDPVGSFRSRARTYGPLGGECRISRLLDPH
jgi:hypothetical protein